MTLVAVVAVVELVALVAVSALPVTSPVRFPVTEVVDKTPVLGLYVSPLSVSAPCVPVAPSTNNGYTVSFAELLAVTVTLVASVAVAEFPVQDPDEPDTLPVTLPVKAPINVVAVTIPAIDAAAPTTLVNSTDGEPVRPAEVPDVF